MLTGSEQLGRKRGGSRRRTGQVLHRRNDAHPASGASAPISNWLPRHTAHEGAPSGHMGPCGTVKHRQMPGRGRWESRADKKQWHRCNTDAPHCLGFTSS